MNAPLQKNETLHSFEDGDETVTVKVIELSDGSYCAFGVPVEYHLGPIGLGFSNIGAIADLFEKMPRAASEREERDDLAAKWDHARDHRKHAAAE